MAKQEVISDVVIVNINLIIQIEGDTQQLLDSIDNLIEEFKETPRTSYKQRSTVGTPQVGTSCTSVERVRYDIVFLFQLFSIGFTY